MADTQTGWRIWWAKRRWYERNHRLSRRLRLDRHAARGGFFVRYPVEGEILEALDEGRLRIGEGTLLEPGCWLTLAPEAEIEIGAGCFLNRATMIAAQTKVTIGDHTMFATGCFVGDADHLAGLHLEGTGGDRRQLLVRCQLRGDQRRDRGGARRRRRQLGGQSRP